MVFVWLKGHISKTGTLQEKYDSADNLFTKDLNTPDTE